MRKSFFRHYKLQIFVNFDRILERFSTFDRYILKFCIKRKESVFLYSELYCLHFTLSSITLSISKPQTEDFIASILFKRMRLPFLVSGPLWPTILHMTILRHSVLSRFLAYFLLTVDADIHVHTTIFSMDRILYVLGAFTIHWNFKFCNGNVLFFPYRSVIFTYMYGFYVYSRSGM